MDINIENQLNDFHQRVNNYSNLIFSARFGDGKTFFLNRFKEKYQESISLFTLYPVNYSVSQNEDIFEYIKHDLLVQLMQEKSLESDYTIDIDAFTKAVFCKETLQSLIHFLLELFPASNITKKIADKCITTSEVYRNEERNVSKYVSCFKDKNGIYEMDAYSVLIRDMVTNVREKRKVLVIEDLDRLDPAHIFRILNVLAAHIDNPQYQEGTCLNKFGFDNVIIVMDYNVTMHIFHHFYGERANYEGYMLKFSNSLPFHYSIKEVAHQQLMDFVKQHIEISDNDFFAIGHDSEFKSDIYSNIALCWDNLSVRRIAEIMENVEKWYKVSKHEKYGDVYFLIAFLRQINFLEGNVRYICNVLCNNWHACFQTICRCFLPFYTHETGESITVYEQTSYPQCAVYENGKVVFRSFDCETGNNVLPYEQSDIINPFKNKFINEVVADVVD